MIGIIFIAMLLALIWGAVLGFGLPLAIAVLPTVVAAAASVAVTVLRRLQAQKSARAIENVLQAQGAAQVESVRPDRKPEVEAMQGEFAKAIAALKSSKLGQGGKGALAVLPWYLLIGPPGGGKSTALRNSGLQFRFLSAKGGGVRGVGGTRNCEWWLTNEAIILDTAGRYTTEDDDRDEWFSFLDTLRKARPQKPVNGLVVAIGIGELCGSEEAAAERGKLIRQRVDEVMSRLRMSLPVYLVLTKLDLISGFVETFGSLPKSERGQIWGFTEPLGEREETATGIFQRRFDELLEVLRAVSLARLPQERQMEARERIFQFPHQLAGLKANLGEFIGELFAEDAYQDTPLMRGVYFTSGTQEGKPIDRVMDAMARAFGIQQELPPRTAPATEAKSYFLRDLFNQVIFRDHGLATGSAKEVKRRSVQRAAYTAAAFGFAALVCLFPTVSFFENRALVRQVRDDAGALRQTLQAQEGIGSTLRALEPLRDRLANLSRYAAEGVPWSMRFGMYQGDAVYRTASVFYGRAVERTLVKPAIDSEARALQEFASAEAQTHAATGAELVEAMRRLKLYLLLTRGDEAGPPLTPSLRAWIGKELAEGLRSRPGIAGNDELIRLAAAQAAFYPQLLEGTELLPDRDVRLVSAVRAALARLSLTRLALEQIVSAPALAEDDVTVGGLVGASAVYLADPAKVRGGFTRKGFEERVSDALDTAEGNADAWVLGSRAAGDDKAFRAELREEYFREYIAEWRGFVDGLHFQIPGTGAELLGMLQDLSRGSPAPLERVFQAVAYNTRLGDAEGGIQQAVGSLADKLKRKLAGAQPKLAAAAQALTGDAQRGPTERSVAEAFAGLVEFGVAPAPASGQQPQPTPLALYQEQLAFLRDALLADVQDPDDHSKLLASLQSARLQVKSLLGLPDVGWRPRLESLLSAPLDALSQTSTNAVAADTDAKWCGAVAGPFWRRLGNRYPFRKDAPDAAIADLAEFFRPGTGTVDAFYQASLKSDLPRSGDVFQFSNRLGGVVSQVYRPEVLTFLGRARQVGEALFSDGSNEPLAQFSIRVRPSPGVERTTLLLDGQEIEYRNGPEEWHALKWPGPTRGGGAALRVSGPRGVSDAIEREGEWGVFRLLEAARIQLAPDGRTFAATWKVPALRAEITIDFRPARAENPFIGSGGLMQLFRSPEVLAPKNIARGGVGCEP